MSALTLAETGIMLIDKTHIAQQCADIRDRIELVHAHTAARLCNGISLRALSIGKHGPEYLTEAALTWVAADTQQRGLAAREIIDMALQGREPCGEGHPRLPPALHGGDGVMLQRPPDIHGICVCKHCEPRVNNPLRPSWYWCSVKAKQVAPRLDCGEQCNSYEQRTQHGGNEDMPQAKGIDWDGPAAEYIDDAGEQPLWEYCEKRLATGQYGEKARLAREIGVTQDSLGSAITRRRAQANGEQPTAKPRPKFVAPPATEPTPEVAPVEQPEPIDSTPEPEPAADVVYEAPTVAVPGEPREHVDLELDPAVVREFLIAMGMGQLFAGFALARDLDRRRAG